MSPILFSAKDITDAVEPEGRNSFAAISKLAALQHGVVGRDQALALRCDPWWIDEEIKRQHLIVVAHAIYAVGHSGLSRRGRAAAGLLRAGAGSALSHDSAARTWGLVDEQTDGPIHVSLASRRGLPHGDNITIHRPRGLLPEDVVTHRGVPLTTPERTIRDLLPTKTVAQITRMLEQTITNLGRSPDDLHAWAATLSPRTPSRGKLFEALDNVVGPAVIRSQLEDAFRNLCQHAQLPMPETNVRVGRWEVDVLWRELLIAIELDSWRFHGGRWQFHQDRRKGLALSREGFELLRLTWPQVKYESREVVDTLRAVIARAEARR